LIVPAVKRSKFISHCHRGMTGGLRAFRSTLDQVSRRGFWIGWCRDVARFCRHCLSCRSYHRGRLPRAKHLQPMITGSIMERCHIDITGPHPRIPRGSKYILTFVDASLSGQKHSRFRTKRRRRLPEFRWSKFSVGLVLQLHFCPIMRVNWMDV